MIEVNIFFYYSLDSIHLNILRLASTFQNTEQKLARLNEITHNKKMKQKDDANFPEMIALFFYATMATVLQKFSTPCCCQLFHTNT